MTKFFLVFKILLFLVMNSYCQNLQLPARNANSLSGTSLATTISSLSREEREAVIYSQFINGNIPEFLRPLIPIKDSISVNGIIHRVTYFVTCDYLSLGANDDYFLMPMTPLLAQKIANALGCYLPTKKMVDKIYSSAKLKLRPQPIAPSAAMITVPIFAQHNDSVQTLRKPQFAQHPLGTLIGGTKKDLIISNSIYNNLKTNVPKPVVIYGWHQLNGIPIQPVYNGHGETYADYSHGIRLVKDSVIVDGISRKISEILSDPVLSSLISDEGIISNAKYSLSTLAPPAPKTFGVTWKSSMSMQIEINAMPQTTYIAYLSKDGLSFPDSVNLNSANFLLQNLKTDSLYYFRLRARDSNGSSSFSEVLAFIPSQNPPSVVVVNGFDRASAGNTYNFIRQHAKAFAELKYSFASATNDAVVQGLVPISNYYIADYILGDESTADETFSNSEQDIIKSYLKNGGALFVSGSEIAWDLDYKGSAGDKEFCQQFLKLQYLNDAPNGQAGIYYNAEGVPNGLFEGINSILFDNGLKGTINVKYPDVVLGVNGGKNCLQYSGLSSSYAGVSFSGMFPGGTKPGKVVAIGFPFETIYPDENRKNILQRVINFFYSSTGVVSNQSIPAEIKLYQNYPNPFNPETIINYQISFSGHVSLKVFDVLGRDVATLVDEFKEPGNYSSLFKLNSSFSSGVYFYRLRAGGFVQTKRMIVLK